MITSDNIAIFELVKNSYDAHATHVLITFEQDWGLVLEKIEERTHSDEAHYKVGNYFRTKEEALEVCSKIVELLKNR